MNKVFDVFFRLIDQLIPPVTTTTTPESTAAPPNDGSVRLVPLPPENRDDIGRVELFYNNAWNTICYAADAQNTGVTVFCRMMGYEHGRIQQLNQLITIYSRAVWCGGDETSIFDCDFGFGGGVSDILNCGLEESTIIQCSNTPIDASTSVTTESLSTTRDPL